LLNESSFNVEPYNNAEYRIISVGHNELIYIRYHQLQLEFQHPEFDELRTLFEKAKNQPEIQAVISRMISYYGDI
jgi:hypothetical protein